MTWKSKLRDELVSRIQPTGLTVYIVYDSQGGSGKNVNTTKRDWQDELITALASAGITVTKATWDIDTYDDRGVLVMFFGSQIIDKQKFKDMISKADSIKWILTIMDHVQEIENFSLFAEKIIKEPDGEIRVQLWKREKVNV